MQASLVYYLCEGLLSMMRECIYTYKLEKLKILIKLLKVGEKK